MTLDKLPKEYERLATTRAIEQNQEYKLANGQKNIIHLFMWRETEEGGTFWSRVHEAKNISELPPLPDKFRVSFIRDKRHKLLLI